MALIADGAPAATFRVSTSRKPPSWRDGSFGTPPGLHAIGERIGGGEPLGMVFRGRAPTGRLAADYPPEERAKNLITTRILRLRGLEPGRNQGAERDSWERYIYIHGTNHEERLGEPFSGGCVEMANEAVLRLFDRVACGDLVFIDAPAPSAA